MNFRNLITAAAWLLFSGCASQSLENTFSNQESRIDSFLESQIKAVPEAEIVHNNGANRLILVQGEGDPLQPKGSVTFHYAGYVFTGSISPSNLFATNDEEIAAQSGWTITDADWSPITINLADKNLIAGLRNGLEGVKQGEECYIVFSGKYGFGKKILGKIPANSALLYHIKVESVSE